MRKLSLSSLVLVVLSLAGVPASAEPLNIVGTGDGLEIFQDLARDFSAAHPGHQVLVPPSIGSGGAIAAVGAGRERIGRIARAVFDIHSTFYVHRSVPVRALTSEQLRQIFDGRITNWKMLGGPDLRIRVVRREEADSSLMALRASLPHFREVVLTERSKLALTTQDALSSIRDNEGAIGFGPYSVDGANLLGVVSVDGTAPMTAGYPAKVRVAIIWHEHKDDTDIKRFLAFLKTPEARRTIARFGALPTDK